MAYTPERTQLTEAKLDETVGIMQDIIKACNYVALGKVSWSEACRAHNLDALKIRQLILLNIHKFRDRRKPLADVDIGEIYDNYEKFYQAVFGDRTLEQATLPTDYKATVDHVLKSTGLTERESFVLMHHFGIGDVDVPSTLEAIGNMVGTKKEAVRQHEAKALQRCRQKPRTDILRKGIAAYSVEAFQKAQLEKQALEHMREEHEALMAKRDEEHKKKMELIDSGTYEEVLVKTMPEDIPGSLRGTPIDVLGLTARPYNALYRADVDNLLEVLRRYGEDSLLMVCNMGKLSKEETVEKFETYVLDTYNVEAKRLYELYREKYGTGGV